MPRRRGLRLPRRTGHHDGGSRSRRGRAPPQGIETVRPCPTTVHPNGARRGRAPPQGIETRHRRHLEGDLRVARRGRAPPQGIETARGRRACRRSNRGPAEVVPRRRGLRPGPATEAALSVTTARRGRAPPQGIETGCRCRRRGGRTSARRGRAPPQGIETVVHHEAAQIHGRARRGRAPPQGIETFVSTPTLTVRVTPAEVVPRRRGLRPARGSQATCTVNGPQRSCPAVTVRAA